MVTESDSRRGPLRRRISLLRAIQALQSVATVIIVGVMISTPVQQIDERPGDVHFIYSFDGPSFATQLTAPIWLALCALVIRARFLSQQSRILQIALLPSMLLLLAVAPLIGRWADGSDGAFAVGWVALGIAVGATFLAVSSMEHPDHGRE